MDESAKPMGLQHARICLCVLCGLPAAGKSTLVQVLADDLRKKNWGCFILSYDELITDDAFELRKGSSDDLQQGQTCWKLSRQGVLRRLERVLHSALASVPATEPECGGDIWSRFAYAAQEQRLIQRSDESVTPSRCTASLAIFLDDNFYYQSMRYEVYQLSRKYSLGFCQVHLQCPLSTCLSRNHTRSCPLPEAVILEMEKRMEPPNLLRNSWEQRSLTLTSYTTFSPQDVELSIGLIVAALDNPLSPVQDDAERKEADRQRCASSALHQADQAIRRIVSQSMQGAREKKMPPRRMKPLALALNQLKAQFLDDLRKQVLQGYPICPRDSVGVERVVSGAVVAFEQEKNNCIEKYMTETSANPSVTI